MIYNCKHAARTGLDELQSRIRTVRTACENLVRTLGHFAQRLSDWRELRHRLHGRLSHAERRTPNAEPPLEHVDVDEPLPVEPDAGDFALLEPAAQTLGREADFVRPPPRRVAADAASASFLLPCAAI
jgi:hypothetical protein